MSLPRSFYAITPGDLDEVTIICPGRYVGLAARCLQTWIGTGIRLPAEFSIERAFSPEELVLTARRPGFGVERHVHHLIAINDVFDLDVEALANAWACRGGEVPAELREGRR